IRSAGEEGYSISFLSPYRKRFTLVTSAVGLTGLQMVELFAARFRQEISHRQYPSRRPLSRVA
ncbi:MAG: hypothetical protein ACM35G_06020, partial [Planctomycetaceae bacterium]